MEITINRDFTESLIYWKDAQRSELVGVACWWHHRQEKRLKS